MWCECVMCFYLRAPEVRSGNIPETFLASCVPNLTCTHTITHTHSHTHTYAHTRQCPSRHNQHDCALFTQAVERQALVCAYTRVCKFTCNLTFLSRICTCFTLKSMPITTTHTHTHNLVTINLTPVQACTQHLQRQGNSRTHTS